MLLGRELAYKTLKDACSCDQKPLISTTVPQQLNDPSILDLTPIMSKQLNGRVHMWTGQFQPVDYQSIELGIYPVTSGREYSDIHDCALCSRSEAQRATAYA
jgi:hypothetical protein